MIYDDASRTHPDMATVLLYACPNLNAEYTADRLDAYRWTGDYPKCAVCGRTRGIDGVHHEPPRSKGPLTIVAGPRRFKVKPTLMTLCSECHRDRHDRAALSFSWEFDSHGHERAFLSGELFGAGWAEHDERFWEIGGLLVTSRGRTWEVRR